MFESLKRLLLQLLKVPPEPDPPWGARSSVRFFRASPKLYYLRLVGWGAAQVFALAALLFCFGIVLASEREANRSHAEAMRGAKAARWVQRPQRNWPLLHGLRDAAGHVPSLVFTTLWIVKGFGLIVYLAQLIVTYATVRLDYEMRWYIVTDRSLRIRSGIWRVDEMTMSFANLQHVTLSQGPLQRLLGIADLRVQSAGGGTVGGGEGQHRQVNPMHTGIFRGVENAVEIRDLILERLRQFRETGLGDPDELRSAGCVHDMRVGETIEAASELLVETRRLRVAVEAATGRA
jgi:membrane protein YdbS with pleckstrin-like domain